MSKILVCLLLAALSTGCAELGIKSVPWATSTGIHDREAVEFLRGAPAVDERLGAGLTAKDMLEDGRLVGMSVSGGGARAAAFTLGVLTELQALKTADGSNALDRLDFISSNSGGSWGVAAYVADRSVSTEANYDLRDRVQEPLIRNFVEMSTGRVSCWNKAMRKHLFGDRTFADIYSSAQGGKLPRVFFNASVLPAHAPFVFTDAFIQHYDVENFGACRGDWVPRTNGIAGLSFGYAAATSGTVPGFYYAYAKTGLCSDDNPAHSASFCHGPTYRQRSYLRLADGGLYDNIGYKTAFEVMHSQEAHFPRLKRAIILVNSNTSMDMKTIVRSDARSDFFFTTASNGVFAVQDATFERMYGPMFRSLGVTQPVLIDFYGAAGLRPDQARLLDDENPRDALKELAFFAAHNVSCYAGSKVIRAERRKLPQLMPSVSESIQTLINKGGDCLSENFYRAGTLGKTTYRADRPLFTILWQLGRLSVRMKRDDILRAVG